MSGLHIDSHDGNLDLVTALSLAAGANDNALVSNEVVFIQAGNTN